MFASIPNDLLLIIWSYLFIFKLVEHRRNDFLIFVVYHEVEDGVEDIEKFMQEDSERSWRNLLAASNSQNWRTMRKETRIWSLNEKSFRKYLTDDCFREYINERMFNPAIQLHCRFIACVRWPPDLETSLVTEITSISNLASINIRGFCLTEFLPLLCFIL
jgi:hypothetical protein